MLIRDYLHQQVTPNLSNPNSLVLNSRSTRILNLGAISLLLLQVTGIYVTKVDANYKLVREGNNIEDKEDSKTKEQADDKQIDKEQADNKQIGDKQLGKEQVDNK